MKWVTFNTHRDGIRTGVLESGQIYSAPEGVTLIDCFGPSREAFDETGRKLLDSPAAVFDVSHVSLLAPVSQPPAVRDFMVFEEHVINGFRGMGSEIDTDWYNLPVFYFSNPASIRGDRQYVPIAPGSERFDFEVELAAIIGWPGANVPLSRATQLIAGYCLFIDWSARDLQAREMRQGLGPAKGKDTAITMGPALVTVDEIERFRAGQGFALEARASVNGRTYVNSNFEAMHWSFEQLIVYASRGTNLRPGDVLASGTCGRGCILEVQVLEGELEYPWLSAGDVVAFEATALGELTNTIAPSAVVHPLDG